MRISFNNTNFGNTFFLYPNKKNIEKTEKFSKRIERKSKTKIASVYPNYVIPIKTTREDGFPIKKGIFKKKIDGVRAVQKIAIDSKTPELDKKIRDFAIENNITFKELNEEELNELILKNIQMPEFFKGDDNYKMVMLGCNRLDYLLRVHGNDEFEKIKENCKNESKSTKKCLEGLLLTGSKIEAPHIYVKSYIDEQTKKVCRKIMLYDKKYSFTKENVCNNSAMYSAYNGASLYFALREMGVKYIPIVTDLRSAILFENENIIF